MRTFLACFFILTSLSASQALPFFSPVTVAVYEQPRIDDGPHVIWEGDTARVHWTRGGTHTVETFKPPFELPLGGLTSIRLRLNGKPYHKAEFDLKEPQRIFAISDIHGFFDVMRDLLLANGVIDSQNRWSFGKGHLVILGDVADRGVQVTQCYWFIRALEEDARKAGGHVHMLIGNHEVMLLTGDYRSVNQMYLNPPKGTPSLAEQYGIRSELGRWLRSRPFMLRLGSTLFLHGGVSSAFLEKKMDIVSVNRKLHIVSREERDEINTFLHGSDGPLWYRGMILDNLDNSIKSEDIDRILAHFKVKRVAIGHTTQDQVGALHNGRILAVDAGIQHRRGEGLYIEKGTIFRALPDGSKIKIGKQ